MTRQIQIMNTHDWCHLLGKVWWGLRSPHRVDINGILYFCSICLTSVRNIPKWLTTAWLWIVSPPLIQCRRFSRPLWKICPLLRAFLVYWFVGFCIKLREQLYTVFRKKHPLTFSFVSPWMMCRFKQKLQWIYVGKVVSENLEIRYSLWPMTSLWRHICLAKVGGSLQHTISHESRISFFASTWYLIGA